jgi:hypothetical protein
MGKTYRSMQGRQVDMEKLMSQHELMPAIGNVRVNARGDELGPGGKIIKKREDIMAEYYDKNPKAIPDTIEPVRTKTVEDKKSEPTIETPVSKKGKSNNES